MAQKGKVGFSYRQHDTGGPYDAIVIGSGIGGLGAAAILSKHARKRVLVLERHYTAGGFTHTFRRPGYAWDVGVHYIGDVLSERAGLRAVFDDVTNGNLHWASMGDVYDRIIFPDRSYDFHTGRAAFRDRLAADFPNEVSAIDKYLSLVSECLKKSQNYWIEKTFPQWLSGFAGGFLRQPFTAYSDKTTYEVLTGLTRNPRLLAVLTGQYGDYGLPPRKSSFAVHAMVANHYFRGGAYPAGGSGKIAETIAPVIENGGGRIMINAEVAEILVEGNRAVGVKMSDGREIHTPLVISDAGFINTWGRLLPAQVSSRFGLLEQLKRLTPSYGHLCLYVGLKYSPQELGLGKANLWIYPGDDHDASVEKFIADSRAPFPVVYISFPSSKDPAFAQEFPGRATIEVITVAKYEWFHQWESARWKHRGKDYETLKEHFLERLLEALYAHLPQVKGKIDYRELSTPLSTRTFANYQYGELYGIDHTPGRFRQHFLRPETPIRGLYMTGQDVCTAGVGGALFGAVLAASSILKRNVLSLIHKNRS